MKFKTVIIFGLIILTLCSISAIYADTFVVGNSSFSLPDGYTLQEKGNQVLIYNDDYVLTMYEGAILSTEDAKHNRIANGYTLLGEKDYEYANAEINQQNYHSKDNITSCVYTVKKNNQTYIITLNVYDYQTIPEYEDNPVTQIIETLERNN